VRARSEGLSVGAVDRALSDDRSLLVSWLNRGTLQLVRSEDYSWLQALTTPPQLKGNSRRLAQLGVDTATTDRAVAVVQRSLARSGPLTRDQLGDRLRRAEIPTGGQILIHLLAEACLRGLSVRGPLVGGKHAYVLVRDWLGEPPPVDRDRALAELARRYLAGHGPADERDLAKWAGLPLRDVRAGLGAIASELSQRDDGLLDLEARQPAADLPPPRLLGSFDPLLLGWRSRDRLLGRHAAKVIAGGIFRPFALVRGRAAGTWRMPAGEVALELFGRVSRDDRACLEAEASDVARFLGGGPS
jgi:hypothetical protein